MRQIDVYMNEQKQAQHLGVQTENLHYLPVAETQFRSLCGANVTGLEAERVDPTAVKVTCKECENQRQMWIEVHSE